MWLMTNKGVLMPSLRPAEHLPEGDDKVYQVRARLRAELEWYRENFLLDQDREIVFMAYTDYEYRIYVTPMELAMSFAEMVTTIDYVKFKPTVLDDALRAAYNAIWTILYSKFSKNRVFDQGWSINYHGKKDQPKQHRLTRRERRELRRNESSVIRIRLEMKNFYHQVDELIEGLEVKAAAVQDSWTGDINPEQIEFTGKLEHLACLSERFDSGVWEITLDEVIKNCTRDDMIALVQDYRV